MQIATLQKDIQVLVEERMRLQETVNALSVPPPPKVVVARLFAGEVRVCVGIYCSGLINYI